MKPEFHINGKYERADRRNDIIYFDRDSAALDEAETVKLQRFAQANAAVTGLELSAFGSDEEASDANRKDLLTARLAAVVSTLRKSGWTGKDSCTVHEWNTEPEIEYREIRRVQVKIPGTVLEGDLSVPAHQPAPPAAAAAFGNALTMLDTAARAIKDGTASGALNTYFADVDPDRVLNRLGAIHALLSSLREATPTNAGLRPGYRYLTRNCGEAYTSKSGSDTLMTLGAPLFRKSPAKQAATLIHEGSHAATGVRTEDIAYCWQRLIREMRGDKALNNADSYLMFVLTANGQDVRGDGPPDDQIDDRFGVSDRADISRTLGYLEAYLVLARQDIRRIHRHAWQTIVNKAPWDDRYTAVLGALRTALASEQDVIACPPEITDNWYLAGIFERATLLSNALRDRSLRLILADQTRWSDGPGRDLRVSDAWFSQGVRGRIEWLLQVLCEATPGIAANWKSAYAKAILGMTDAGKYARF